MIAEINTLAAMLIRDKSRYEGSPYGKPLTDLIPAGKKTHPKCNRIAAAFPKMSRERKLAILSQIFGRPLKSSKELRFAEACAVEALAFVENTWQLEPEWLTFIQEFPLERTESV